MTNQQLVNPFINQPAFNSRPALPDIENQEPLGSGVVTKLLGHGGMANVYEIWIPNLEVFRAVKIIKPDCSKDALERFQTEIKILAKLAHPNIIHIHSVGEWKGLPYIEMDKIDGWTLSEIISEKGALPLEIITAVAVLVLRALVFAHSHKFKLYGTEYNGVIHRDLKPNNIMLCNNGELVLMDFGVARPADASFHTTDGAVVGTVQYMSPEMLVGKKFDSRTDIYAFGATLYEIATGINPFWETNFSKLITLKQKNKFRHLNEFHLKIPGKLKRIIHKCMSTDPDKRFRNAGALLSVFEKLHAKLSDEKPEEVMIRYASAITPGNRYTPRFRFYISLKTIILSLFAVIFLAALFVGGLRYREMYLEKQNAEAAVADSLKKLSMISVATVAPKQPELPQQNMRTIEKRSAVDPIRPVQTDQKSNKSEVAADIPKPTSMEEKKPLTLLEKLAETHAIRDIHEIIRQEYSLGNTASIITLFEEQKQVAYTDRDNVIVLMALKKENQNRKLASFLAQNTVNAFEFYSARAQRALAESRFDTAESECAKAATATRVLTTNDDAEKTLLYIKASIASARFYQSPEKDRYLAALEQWRNYGALFGSDRQSEKYREYREEVKKLSEQFQSVEQNQ